MNEKKRMLILKGEIPIEADKRRNVRLLLEKNIHRFCK